MYLLFHYLLIILQQIKHQKNIFIYQNKMLLKLKKKTKTKSKAKF